MNPMHDEAFHAILEAKYARIINEISQMYNVSLEEAMDIFYNSPLLPLLEEGIADLHCRSDKYLAEEIWREKEESTDLKNLHSKNIWTNQLKKQNNNEYEFSFTFFICDLLYYNHEWIGIYI